MLSSSQPVISDRLRACHIGQTYMHTTCQKQRVGSFMTTLVFGFPDWLDKPYGVTQDTHILINNCKDHFSPSSNPYFTTIQIGFVNQPAK